MTLKEKRENVRENIFRRCYDYGLTLGKLLDIEPDIPRIAGRQKHRANVSASIPSDYYLGNMRFPYLDHLIEGSNSI